MGADGSETDEADSFAVEVVTGDAEVVLAPFTLFDAGIDDREAAKCGENEHDGMFGDAASVDPSIDANRDVAGVDGFEVEGVETDAGALDHFQPGSEVEQFAIDFDAPADQ